MKHVRSEADLPKLSIFSSNPLLSDALSSALGDRGLSVHSKRLGTQLTFNANDLVAWILADPLAELPFVISTLSAASTFPGKALVAFPVDIPQKTQPVIDEKMREIDGYISKIIGLCRHKQIDIRIVGHHSIYGPATVGEGSVLAGIVSQLKSGNLIQLPRRQLFPIEVEQLASSIMTVWFDRAHKYQKVLIKGSPVAAEEINTTLARLGPVADTYSQVWSDGEGIAPDDIIEIKSDISILYHNLTASFIHPVPAIPTPTVPLPRAVSQPPPTRHVPQPDIIPPPVAVMTVVSTATSRPWSRHVKYASVALISTVIAYLLVTYGLFALSLANAVRFDPEKGDQIKTASLNIQQARARYQKLAVIPVFNHYFEAKYNAAQKLLLYSQAKHHGTNGLSMILGTKEGDPYKEISQAKLILDQLYEIETIAKSDESIINNIESIRQLLTLYPQIIPEDKKITLLLLLQNNLELRPTGGFIGSVGIVTLDRGKVLNLETRNIYDLDSNLRGVVTPPPEVTQYLGEASWYFRDSNWNPDFVEAAKTADWFLDKEWGSRADIVVGLNINSLKDIIGALGSISLVNGTAVNAENLLVTTLNSQESIVGSSSQPELLSLIVSSLINQINQAPIETKAALLSAVHASLEKGETTIAIGDRPAAVVLDDLRLSGTTYAPICPPHLPEPCLPDHFYLNEANVGINKANYYLSRRHAHTASVIAGNLNHTHRLTLQNTSPNDTWPAGSYKSFYRAYLPVAATDILITIDGQTIPSQNLSFSTQSVFRIVGWFHELKPQSNVEMVISYKLPFPNSLKGYQLFIQKQPGAMQSDLSFSFTGPNLPYSADAVFDRHLAFPIKFSP
jgi:hypothetical protein